MQKIHTARPTRFLYLDALRGLAAMWVVMVHIAMLPNPRIMLPDWLDIFVIKGAMGVDLFFVVSAYSLCLSMPTHDHDTRPVVGFALRRFFRIAPLFYFMLLIMTWRNFSGVIIDERSVALNLTFLFNLVPGYQTSIVPAGWTIGVEMIFYLIFPILYRVTKNIWHALVAVCAALTIAQLFLMVIHLFVSDPGNYNLFSIFYRAPIFMFGLVAFYAMPKFASLPDSRPIGYAILAFCPVLFFAIANGKVPLVDPYYWNGLLFAMVVVGLGLSPIKLVVNKLIAALGKISYSIYLVHTPIIVTLIPTMRSIQAAVPSHTLAYSLIFFMVTALVIPVAAATYFLIEKPGNMYGKRIANWFAGTKPAELVNNRQDVFVRQN